MSKHHANQVQKLYSLIVENREKNKDSECYKELEELKEKCLSEDVESSRLASQALIQLSANKIISSKSVIKQFMPLIGTDNNSYHVTILTNFVVELLLQDLKHKINSLKPGEKYNSPYGISPPQDPLIIIFQKYSISRKSDFVYIITAICNHHDKQIQENCIEFLRQFYLFVFCNTTELYVVANGLWLVLLSQAEKSSDAHRLVIDILSWMRFDSMERCQQNTNLIMVAIEQLMGNNRNDRLVSELLVYLTSVIKLYSSFGFDCRPLFHLMLKVFYTKNEFVIGVENLILMILAETFSEISPVYFSDILRVITYLVLKRHRGNVISLNIIADTIIQWIVEPFFLKSTFIAEFQTLLEFITSDRYKLKLSEGKSNYSSNLAVFIPEKSVSYELCKLCENGSIENFIKNLKNPKFQMQINLVLRSLFISRSISTENWSLLFEIQIGLIRSHKSQAKVSLMPFLYLLSNRTNPQQHLKILKSICECGALKDNIPIILNTFDALTQKHLSSLSLDLYLQLWKIEPRTYQFLNKMLTRTVAKEWELEIARANAIKQICAERPAIGTSMIGLLSKILNTCESDVATSIALDAITILCENNIINIVSTWNVLKGKFLNEGRQRTIKSLCRLFGVVPLLKMPTLEYESLVAEVTALLWDHATSFNDPEINIAAFNALKNFDIEIMQLEQIPTVFRQNVVETNSTAIIDQFIPGECWIQVLKNIDYSSAPGAVEMLGTFISHEIDGFRGGVYIVPEGRPEPKHMKNLPGKCILRSIVTHIIKLSSDYSMEDEFCLENCLNVLRRNFSKPIPPLDWTFLHEFMHRGIKIRSHCVNIAVNQSVCSGTAKRLVENFIKDFTPELADPEELRLIFELLPKLFDAVSDNIFKKFLTACFDYATNDGNEEILLDTLKSLRISLKLKDKMHPEKNDICLMLLNDCMDKFGGKKMIDSIIETICALPQETVEKYVSLDSDREILESGLQRSLLIRCHLIEGGGTDLELPFLAPIINVYAEQPDMDRKFFFKTLSSLLSNYHDTTKVCDWILEILNQIHFVISKGHVFQRQCLFLCDLLIVIVITSSGLYSFRGDPGRLTDASDYHLLFAQSLMWLPEKDKWESEKINKIIESLYHLYLSESIPAQLKEIFKVAIMCSKNYMNLDGYKKDHWMKYVNLR